MFQGSTTEDETSFNNEKQRHANNPKVENNRSNDNMETKMAFHYPKGEFRFPVIPDLERRIRDNSGTKSQIKPKKSEGSTEKQKPVQAKIAEKPAAFKRAFTPTTIPSPIYGFKDRPIVEAEEVYYELETSSPLNPQSENEEISLGFSQDLDYESKDESILPATEIDSSDVKEASVDPSPDNIMESRIGSDISARQEENPELIDEKEMDVQSANETIAAKEGFSEPQSINETDVIEKDSSHRNEESLSNLKEETTKKPERKEKRRRVPFNVLMLNQDRERLASKRAVSQHNSVEVDTAKQEENVQEQEIVSSPPIPQVVTTEASHDIYHFPDLTMLSPPQKGEEDEKWLQHQSDLLNHTLINFNVKAQVVNVTQGPSVTRFEVQPEPGVKVNKITNLSDDLKLSLAARDIRLEAPIPGKHTIGIEIPNEKSRAVFIREIIESPAFQQTKSPLTTVLGLDISGKPVVTDLNKMPHGLIAGATGSGKSVCINSIIVSLLYKARPDEVKLLLIDPKMVELAPYNHIPHLVSPVITDVKAATAALKWAVEEMERRYELFAHTGVRDIGRFNDLAEKNEKTSTKLPYIVIIIDELADLMMMSPGEVEESICRIAQKARACGIHLLVATQRPSVDVITGLIKANVPTRVAFSVSSQVDSRTIIDIGGAEKLLGKGDMLFLENGSSKSVRLQGTFVSDEEIDVIVKHVRAQQKPNYLFHQDELLKKASIQEDEDELFYEACEFVVNQGGASASLLQRRFRIGYNRAARLVDMMEDQGIISETRGSKPRDILISEEDLEQHH
ncbi:DNA translocase FtsK [Bacillus sp. 2205SS5-2]|uniref:DNA translocase FtsK n=1 Tax=Bacillus sp. 2205SS5-2 TaxID=3109031 RepID=UPI003FA5BB66